jgi:hypothetical protein
MSGCISVRGGSDAGAVVVGLSEAGAGSGERAGAQGVVWDHAAFHKAEVVGEFGLRRIYQPALFV